MTSNEFARPLRLDTIGEDERTLTIDADQAERAALAARFDLAALHSLSAILSVRRAGEIVHVRGTVSAQVTQTCVATAAPLPNALTIPFTLRFVPEALAATHEEVELDADACDTIEYDGASVDLGEAAAETLYLALDPFPRAPDADAILKAAGVLAEGEAGPFAVLQGLKDRLNR